MGPHSWDSNHGTEIMGQQSWDSDHGTAIMGQQSCDRNHATAIIARSHRCQPAQQSHPIKREIATRSSYQQSHTIKLSAIASQSSYQQSHHNQAISNRITIKRRPVATKSARHRTAARYQPSGSPAATPCQSRPNQVAITWQSHGNPTSIKRKSHGNLMATPRQHHGNPTAIPHVSLC